MHTCGRHTGTLHKCCLSPCIGQGSMISAGRTQRCHSLLWLRNPGPGGTRAELSPACLGSRHTRAGAETHKRAGIAPLPRNEAPPLVTNTVTHSSARGYLSHLHMGERDLLKKSSVRIPMKVYSK